MAEEPNNSKEDQIRVIDEEPVDVVRLDVGKMSPLEKKGKMSNTVLAPMPELGAEEKPLEKTLFDPESEWQEGEEESGNETVPVGWFVLLAAGLLGILGWVVFQTMSDDPANSNVNFEAGNQRVGDGLQRPMSAEDEENERRAAEVHFTNMEKVVTRFLKSGTQEEMIKWVRHPKRIAPLMKSYYEQNSMEPLTLKSTDEYHIAALEKKPFVALKVRVKEQDEGVAILLEDNSEKMLVDWESFVSYLPMTPEDIAESRPTKPMSLRVYVQRDNFYTYEFSDDKEYACFRLEFRDSAVTLYGFVKKGTILEREFLKMFPEENNKLTKPLVIKARFLEGGKATRSMLIESLESTMWAFANNPDEVDHKN
jgi:hypothetical protein